MIRTFRKVEVAAAAFYAASFALWTYQAPVPEPVDDLRCAFCLPAMEAYFTTITGREYAGFALLVIAVGLTIAAVRLRRSEQHTY